MILGFVGIGISIMTLGMLIFVFKLEERRGRRFGEETRTVLDTTVTNIRKIFSSIFIYIARDFKLTAHFFFHKFLTLSLKLLEWFQSRVRILMRSNKKSAHKSLGEITVRNKLHEIADHKASTALSEEEKKKHKKEKLLNG